MPLRNDLLNPIPGDNPSGANLRYEPITDKIKEARREDIDAPQGQWKTTVKTADLPLVIKLAGDVLANRSKDLQIAVWLVDAHVRREGFGILTPCLELLRELVEQYWDTLYPPIDEDGDMEVRATPLGWLGAKLGEQLGFLPIVSGKLSWVKYQESRTVGFEADADTFDKQQLRQSRMAEGKISGEQFDEAADATSVDALKNTYKQLTAAQQALESLSEYCDSQFGDYAPSFINTRNALEEITQTVRIILSRKPGGLEEEEEPAEEEPVEEASMEESPSEEETVATEDSFGTEESVSFEEPAADEESSFAESSESEEMASFSGSGESLGELNSREDAARQLVSICRFLRSQNGADPAPYLMLRVFAWGAMMKDAPILDQSAIEAPPGDVRVNLRRLAKESQWEELVEATEAAMAEPYGRTWLDLQRYTESGISGLGYAGAARVVNTQFRILLETLPDLLELTLPDDTPAANAETKTWINNSIIEKVVPKDLPKPPGEEGSESSGFGDDTSTESSFSMDETPSTDMSLDETPSDISLDETPSDMSLDATPEPEAAEAEPTPEPEPEPYEVEENPPILEAEEAPPSDLSDEFAQALAAVKDGRTAEGLGIITAMLATERSGRARFRRRTQLAHLLMAAGKGKVAQPMLDELVDEIENRKLEDWEPSEAIAYPLELLLHCLSPADERRTQLYTRICKLDPVRAVNCSD
jgi:type VI secretion system protein ImpA